MDKLGYTLCFCLQRYFVDDALLLSQKRNSVCGGVETVWEELRFLQILGLRYFRTSCNKALALTKVPASTGEKLMGRTGKCRGVLSRNKEFSVRLGNGSPRPGVSLCNSLRMDVCVSCGGRFGVRNTSRNVDM